MIYFCHLGTNYNISLLHIFVLQYIGKKKKWLYCFRSRFFLLGHWRNLDLSFFFFFFYGRKGSPNFFSMVCLAWFSCRCISIYFSFLLFFFWCSWDCCCYTNLSFCVCDTECSIHSVVKNPPANAETEEGRVWSLGWEDPLEEGMATTLVF